MARFQSVTLGAALLGAGLLVTAQTVWSQVQFGDVTDTAGIDKRGETWGASWGDLNNDGRMDLFVNNHRELPSVFVNLGDGRFKDVAFDVDLKGVWLGNPIADQHGASWADADNDGDDDLLITVSNGQDAQFMVNENGILVERAVDFDLQSQSAGRFPAWLDYNGDGWLDVAYMKYGNVRIRRRDVGVDDFDSGTSETGVDCDYDNYAQLIDLNGDDFLDFVCARKDSAFPEKIYDMKSSYLSGGGSFTEIAGFPPIGLVSDTVIGDFDNDGRNDMLLVRGLIRPAVAKKIVGTNRIEAWAWGGASSGEKGFSFTAGGNITVKINSYQVGQPDQIFIGSSGWNPSGNEFTLDPTNTLYHGVESHDPGADRGMYIGYDPGTNVWTVLHSPGDGSSRAYIEVEASNSISEPTNIGLIYADGPVPPRLIMNTASGFVDATGPAQINAGIMCSSGAAADFDNDGYMDIYLGCRSGIGNLENIYFHNDGDGTFSKVASAGGAGGPIGEGLASGVGTAENVVLADYDTDGFIDLFVTNGLLMQPRDVGGPHKLFRNLGNSNSWLEIDLEGSARDGVSGTNRSAIGAIVTIETPDGKRQMREQNGGYHRWAQNSQRIHFGLGTAQTADVSVLWPGESVPQVFEDVAADKLYRIGEDGTINEVQLGNPGTPPINDGDQCGDPGRNPGLIAGVVVWEECSGGAGTGTWHVEVAAGGSTQSIVFEGGLRSTGMLTNVVESSFEGGDAVTAPNVESLDFSMSVSNLGVDEFSFDAVDNETLCLTVDAPNNPLVFLGSGLRGISPPFDLDGLVDCVQVSIADVSVDEDAGNALFQVSLSNAVGSSLSVSYATANESAAAPDDYAARTGQVTFPANSTTPQTISVPIVDDGASEGDETFTVTLSGAGAGVVLARAVARGTIRDNEQSACGKPDFNPATDSVIAAWQDCASGLWNVQVAAGGVSGRRDGVITSGEALTGLNEISIETSDVVNSDPDPKVLDFVLKVGGAGTDTLQFGATPGEGVCLDVTRPAGGPVLIGAAGVLTPAPVDLQTLGPCSEEGMLSIDDVSVDESTGTAVFTVSLTAGTGSEVTVNYATSDETASAGDDYDATGGQVVFPANDTTPQQISVNIREDSDAEPSETFRVTLSGPSGNAALSKAVGIGTIRDNEVSACGKPPINPTAGNVIAAWQDCGNGLWNVQVSAGGVSGRIEGVITSGEALTDLNKISIETSDVVDSDPDPKVLDFVLRVGGSGTDTLQFAATSDNGVCLDVTRPSGGPVLIGAAGVFRSAPVDLETLGPCVEQPTLNIDDVSVSEDAGTATFTVSLTGATGNLVTVDFATSDGTATLTDDDYVQNSGQLNFSTGTTPQMVVVQILEDSEVEGNETFNVNLTNPGGGAQLGKSLGIGTIRDNELSACGKPSVDSGSETGVFVWQNCNSPELEWHVLVTGGGNSTVQRYGGEITSTQAIQNADDPGLEGSDVFDSNVDPNVLDFVLKVLNAGTDEFTFEAAAGAGACLEVTRPSAGNVLIGASRMPFATPIDLQTLGGC